MLGELITLTPGFHNEYIVFEKAQVRNAVFPIMDLNTLWDSALE
jgi:hypothetical protein